MNRLSREEKYKEIKQAAKILKLSDTATLKEVKEHYRRLIKKWHPDKCKKKIETCNQKINEINKSYNTILDFIKNYKFSFEDNDLKNYFDLETWWGDKFGNDPIWGQNK